MEKSSTGALLALHSALISQACYALTSPWSFYWTSLLPLNFKDTLNEYVARLQNANRKLLSASEMVECLSYALEESDRKSSDLSVLCKWATSELQSTFLLFRPIYNLQYALLDYHRSGGTGRNKDHRVLVIEGLGGSEIDPLKFGGRKIVVNFIGAYEASITRVLSRIQEVVEHQDNISLYFQRRPVSLLFKGVEFHGRPDRQYLAIEPLKDAGSVRVSKVEAVFNRSQVVVECWACRIPGVSGLLKLPKLLNLQNRHIESGTFADFSLTDWTLTELNKLIRVATYLIFVRRQYLHSLQPRNTYQVDSIGDEDAETGLLWLRDDMRVGVGITKTRLKKMQVRLYQNFLIIGRWKGPSLVIVHKVRMSDLLQINFEPPYYKRIFGGLFVFWKTQPGKGATCATLCSSDPLTLTIWAAFLASAASKLPVTRSFQLPNLPSISVFDFPYLEYVRELQQLFGLLPLIRSKELDPYDGNSMNFHLIQLGRSLSQLRSEMPPLQLPKEGEGRVMGDADPEEEKT